VQGNSKLFFVFIILVLAGCREELGSGSAATKAIPRPALGSIENPSIRSLLTNAQEQLNVTKYYSQEYFNIEYPNGDPPLETGACTDVVIRAFRSAGVDLQKEVHEDMQANFALYPNKWGLQRPDTNIDHRRVPNLQTFFTRKGKSISVSLRSESYEPGDVVSWDLNGKGMTHIGIVSHLWNERTKRYLMIHNMGGGVMAEDRLFDWTITGHYRYF
jgi:uncharacterized protein YijF (DUF1287 family)